MGSRSPIRTELPQPYKKVRMKVFTPAPRDNGAALLDETRAFVRRFWAPPSEVALDAVTLWIAHSHAVNDDRLVFETTPRLFLCSTGPQSGKTTALQMLELLCGRGKRIADPTAPALLGLLGHERATILIDELDTLMGNGAGGRSTRTIMLEGYTEGGSIARGTNARGYTEVSCFAPMAFAGMRQNFISNPRLEALRTRTIMLLCKPRGPNQVVESYRRRLHSGQARVLNVALTRWGSRHANTLMDCWPEPPDGVEDRAAELWEPLLAVGEVVGGEWAERARNACRVIALGEPEEDDDEPDTPVEMLLADMSLVFMGEDRLASRTIIERLQLLPGSAWKRFPNVVTAGREIAAMLEPRGVAPKPVWLDGVTVRGYDRADLEEAGMPVLAELSKQEKSTELPF
jgi:hypothetical protein